MLSYTMFGIFGAKYGLVRPFNLYVSVVRKSQRCYISQTESVNWTIDTITNKSIVNNLLYVIPSL